MFHVPGPALRANLAHSELIPVQKNRAKIPSLESSDGLHVRLPKDLISLIAMQVLFILDEL